MAEDLKDKIILITGSSSGIGLATAKILAGLGARVMLNSREPGEELEKAKREVVNSDGFVCDITNEKAVAAMVAEIINKYGRIDGLVNNAGGGGWATVLDDDAEWQKSFALDIMGAVHLCRYVLPQMAKQGGGTVVNICSLWGMSQNAKPSIASYSVAKAGLVKLTENLAQQFAPKIRVNGVSPGWTKTRMILDDFNEDGIKFMEKNVLLKRLAEPEEIGKVVVFLLSNDSSFITGQIICADGGYTLCRDHPDSQR